MVPRLGCRVAVLALVGAVVASACGHAKPADAPNPGHQRSATIVVSGAASLTAAFSEIAARFERAHPNVKVEVNFGASSTLAAQIVAGAAADVFAAADAASMRRLSSLGLTGGVPAAFAANRLVIVTKLGNPAGVARLADLSHVTVVSLCAVATPCGAYARRVLDRAGVSIPESHVTRGQNAAATLTAVADGDAVAGIVYATDARAHATLHTVAIPAAQNTVATYVITLLRGSRNAAVGTAFVRYVLANAGQGVLRDFGFLRAT